METILSLTDTSRNFSGRKLTTRGVIHDGDAESLCSEARLVTVTAGLAVVP